MLELNPAGDILALGAAFVWAAYSILMKKIGVNTSNMIICTRRIFFYGIAPVSYTHLDVYKRQLPYERVPLQRTCGSL